MKDFTLKIDTKEGTAVFRFTRIYTVKGVIYFTAVSCRSFRHYFHMEERDGRWQIVKAPKPPDWLFEHEEQLAKAIMDNQD